MSDESGREREDEEMVEPGENAEERGEEVVGANGEKEYHFNLLIVYN